MTNTKAHPVVPKKFGCLHPGCGKSFRRRDYLQRHESNHATIKPFICTVCKVSFARKDLLEKHQRSKSHIAATNSTDNRIGNNCHDINTNPVNTCVSAAPLTHSISSHPIHDSGPHKSIGTKDLNNLDLFDNVSSKMRFSNVANVVEDSFGWLFGNDEQSYDLGHLLSDSNFSTNIHTATSTGVPTPAVVNNLQHEQPQRDVNIDYGLYHELSLKLIDYLKHELQAEDFNNNIENLFSKSSMTFFLDQYWKYFNCVYPIIHRTTSFDLTVKESLADLHLILLASMITIGMLYTPSRSRKDNVQYAIAVDVQKKLRMQIYQALNSFEYTIDTIPLNLLQSLLLNDVFHMYFGDSVQLTRYTIYHSVAINTFKEFKLFDSLAEPPISMQESQERRTKSWLKWVRYETLKRLALFCYTLDAQSTFFYGLIPSISVFDIQLELPYSDDVWNADDANSFFDCYFRLPRHLTTRTALYSEGSSHKRYEINEDDVYSNGNLIPNVKPEGKWPNFLFSLRNLMQPPSKNYEDELEYHFNCFSQFSRFVFLHGVLSLLKELRTTKIIVDMDDSAGKRLNFVTARIEGAFFSWKAYFHNNIAESNAAVSLAHDGAILNVYDTSSMFWANITLLNVGLLGLYSNFELIVQFSKLVVSEHQQHDQQSDAHLSPGRVRFDGIASAKNRMLVRSWAKSKDGNHSMDQACSLLRMVLSNEDMITSVPHLPYSMYLATLVCWAYGANTFLCHCAVAGTPLGAESNVKESALKFLGMKLMRKLKRMKHQYC